MRFYTNVEQWGNSLLVREVNESGVRIKHKVKYKPTFFVPHQTSSEFKTIDGRNVMPSKQNSIKEAKEFYKDQSDIYGNDQFPYCYIADTYKEDVVFDISKLAIFSLDIEVACENGFPNVEHAEDPILLITIKNYNTKKIYVWSYRDYQHDNPNISFIKCEDESAMLKSFLLFWQKIYPDIITGWNIEFFDMPYLINRIKNLGLNADRLSAWGQVFEQNRYVMGRQYQCYNIRGTANLDYLKLYKKFTQNARESYALNYIAELELGETKKENPYSTFKEWYSKDFQSFTDYNIVDVELIDKMEDKMRLIELLLTMAYEAKCNYEDAFTSVKYWDILLFNHLKKQKKVIPPKKNHDKTTQFQGAFVKEPQLGLHKHIVSFDIASMYPNTIIQFNISPETLIEKRQLKRIDRKEAAYLVEKMEDDSKIQETSPTKFLNGTVDEKMLAAVKALNFSICANGTLYNNSEQGFLPEVIQKMYNQRKEFKKKQKDAEQEYEKTKNDLYLTEISRYKIRQMALKTSLNSAYGAIGNAWFRFFDMRLSEAVTTSGKLSIRWIEKVINQYMNKIMKTQDEDYIVAIDTDSVFIDFETLVAKYFKDEVLSDKIVDFLDALSTAQIQPIIIKSFNDLAEYLNVFEQKMEMAREVIANRAIWTAKKRYILNVLDQEGIRYSKPKMKISGIEAIKSSTPSPCRNKIKEALSLIIEGDSKKINTFIRIFREEFLKLPVEQIAYPRSVNGLRKYIGDGGGLYIKGTPIHTKGALLFNHLLKEHKLNNKYPPIEEGEKIKFLHLKAANPYQTSSIAFINILPPEFDLEQYCDKELQFEKSFIAPLEFLTRSVGITIDRSYGRSRSILDFV